MTGISIFLHNFKIWLLVGIVFALEIKDEESMPKERIYRFTEIKSLNIFAQSRTEITISLKSET